MASARAKSSTSERRQIGGGMTGTSVDTTAVRRDTEPMRQTATIFAIGAAILLVGCSSAATETSGSGEPTVSEGTPEVSTPRPIKPPAAELCDPLSDVLTILANAEVSLREGRSTQMEMDGASHLAARVLHRIPAIDTSTEPSDGGDISTAIGELKSIAPLAALAPGETSYYPSEEWDEAMMSANHACEAAGADLGIMMWTGG
jgi:hypothetical protein